MAESPNIQEIEIILGVIEKRNPAVTSVEQFDRDHEVLLDTQSEIAELELRDSEVATAVSRDDATALLRRIQAAIDANRSARLAARSGQD